ncbi:MAG TPA: DUF4157 domain-containing protein [Longimicrobiaceae bacterium]|nr:DUF4157 domain-containing protein [Longimicrobiaceae bacterium]
MDTRSGRVVKVAPQASAPVRGTLPERSFTAQPETAQPAPVKEGPAVQMKDPGALGHDFGRVAVHPNVLRPPSGGQPLPGPVQTKMEAAFGHDFSGVRIHQGPEAASIGASAFTRGTNIHFVPGRYDPHSQEGQRLLGHELTHVVQQRAGKVAAPQGGGVPINDDRGHEAEADAAGARAAAGKLVSVSGSAAGVQRKAEIGGGGVIQCEGKDPEKNKPFIQDKHSFLGGLLGLMSLHPRLKKVAVPMQVASAGLTMSGAMGSEGRANSMAAIQNLTKPMPHESMGEYDMPPGLRHPSMQQFSTNLPDPPPNLSGLDEILKKQK